MVYYMTQTTQNRFAIRQFKKKKLFLNKCTGLFLKGSKSGRLRHHFAPASLQDSKLTNKKKGYT